MDNLVKREKFKSTVPSPHTITDKVARERVKKDTSSLSYPQPK
jgi:hypothetical protein